VKRRRLDSDFDPDLLNRRKWFVIRIPFEWIAKFYRIIFQKGGKENEKV
jgi:hypothetical protein